MTNDGDMERDAECVNRSHAVKEPRHATSVWQGNRFSVVIGSRINGHSVMPAPPHHQNSVGTCCVQRVAQ